MTITDDLKDALARELDSLTAAREEIRLKAHLAKADAKTDLDKLEQTWERVQEQAKRIHTKADLEASLRGLIEELKSGYERLKRQLV
ncbi:MAG TPA: hypothetical protein VHZ95_15795 [Polyangiales bacterium]|jgi:chromosome segregation ATPase|nr:hypothetical protein [Polyangiales bacterium]